MRRLIATRTAPPADWALAERHLLARMAEAGAAFVARYTRADGTMIWRDAWPGMDGSDDAYESFGNFALFHALGGDEAVHRLARFEWEAITRQFTGYGQIRREYDAYYDWMHHGESSHLIYAFGLCDPTVAIDRARLLRFARMYTGDDAEALNYDRERRMIRSPITGSRGPRFVNCAEDWVTHRPILALYPPPFEDLPGVTGPLCDWNDETVFAAVLELMNERMMRCDVPLNLTATSLVTCAHLYSGDEALRAWVLDYTAAWRERAAANGGLLPDNIGPNGIVGETMDGKWYGGYYGWRWPHGLLNLIEPSLIAAANCLLLTGDPDWLELPRTQLRLVCEQGRRDAEGWLTVPHRHGDAGWYDFRRLDPRYHAVLAYLSQAESDRAALAALAPPGHRWPVHGRRGKGEQEHAAPLLDYHAGAAPEHHAAMLAAAADEMQRRQRRIEADDGDPETWDVHHWQELNPIGTEALVQLTLGGPSPIYHGGLLHVAVRYFDPEARRAGLPPGIAALAERVTGDTVELRLANLEVLHPRRLVVQGGAYGEHEFVAAALDGGEAVPVGGPWLELVLPPGGAARLRLTVRRHARRPSFARPWDGDG